MTVNLEALVELGRADVDPGSGAHADVRGDARFDALQAELAKLSSPGAGMHVDWQAVAGGSAALLRDAGKDLLVGCYLAGALLHVADAAGLRRGLAIVGDLIEWHWEGMSPPVSRMRARRGALQWLLDRIDAVGETRPAGSGNAYPPDLVEQLRADARRIDVLLAARDDDAPTMRAVRAFADRLPVASDGGQTDGGQTDGAAGDISMRPGVVHAEPGPAGPSGRVVPRPDDADAAWALPPSSGSSLEDAAGRERALDDTGAYLHRIATAFARADWTDARAFRLRRFACWFNVRSMPDVEQESGRTRVAAPNARIVDVAKDIDLRAEPEDAVRFAEEHAPVFPLWLDLQRIAGRALARAGGSGESARREVEASTRMLLARLPDLAVSRFADGTPFADDATRAWLDALQGTTKAAQAAHAAAPDVSGRMRSDMPDDPIDDAVAHARAFAVTGRLDSALEAIQDAIDREPTAERRLRLRIGLCELMRESDTDTWPDAFVQGVIEPIRRHDLLVWAPGLALDGLSAAYALLIRRDRESARARAVLEAIAGVDAARAMRLAKSSG
ncbi:type VI secretion system protein TssA [Burkholderia alba]|uniref:type VI secretion system protein TssA n=1 Tax=Burkholderia alba TaxID=2683677 RepID=UPI002B053ED5|nr:type VI secretion system protein TssA [Burkholderia alba]